MTTKETKNTREQFAEWLSAQMGTAPAPAESIAPEDPELRSYPIVKDGGEVSTHGMSSPRDKFVEWFNSEW